MAYDESDEGWSMPKPDPGGPETVWLAELASRIGSVRSIVDIGSGDGALARFLGAAFGRPVTCIERNPKKIEDELAVQQPELTPVHADCDDLPIASGSIDLVFFSQLFIRLDDLGQRAIAEAARIVKPGGHVAVLDFCGEYTDGYFQARYLAEFDEVLKRDGPSVEVITADAFDSGLLLREIRPSYRPVFDDLTIFGIQTMMDFDSRRKFGDEWFKETMSRIDADIDADLEGPIGNTMPMLVFEKLAV